MDIIMKKIALATMVMAACLSFAACGTTTKSEFGGVQAESSETVNATTISETLATLSDEELNGQSETFVWQDESDLNTMEVFEGEWWDMTSQRARMSIAYNGEGYDVTISWANEGTEAQWSMKGIYNTDFNAITYTDGVCNDLTYLESGEVQTTERYSDGEGMFYIIDGVMHWSDLTESAGESCLFMKAE